jgi:hypothetical protein
LSADDFLNIVFQFAGLNAQVKEGEVVGRVASSDEKLQKRI